MQLLRPSFLPALHIQQANPWFQEEGQKSGSIMLLNKVCRRSVVFLSKHFIISFVILPKPGAFLVFKCLRLSLISATVIFLVQRVNWSSVKLVSLLLSSCSFFVLDSCSVYLNHSIMRESDIQLTYYLNYPRLAKVTHIRGKAANTLTSSITSNYIHKSTGMLE